MTREEIIDRNDRLRQLFKGGRIEVCHGPYEIDDRTLGRMLCILGLYSKFDADSLHDHGVFIFAGYQCEFQISEIDGDLVLRLWVAHDVLQGA